MKGCNYLTITPVSKNIKNKGRIDYNEQERRTSTHGYKWCWDDSKHNKAKIGEYFAFLFFEKRVIIHKIENIKPPSQRLDSWSQNDGQHDRQVLELSNPLKELSWREWLASNGPECKQCTYTTETTKRPLLHEMLMKIEKESENVEKKRDATVKTSSCMSCEKSS